MSLIEEVIRTFVLRNLLTELYRTIYNTKKKKNECDSTNYQLF